MHLEKIHIDVPDVKNITVLCWSDFGRMAHGAYQDTTTSLREQTRNRPLKVIFPTGGTPQPLYKHLEADENIIGIQLDEYIDPQTGVIMSRTDPRSYAAEVSAQAFDRLQLPQSNRVLFQEGAAPQDGCERMNEILSDQLDGAIDLAILGIGPNGHIGFNEPGLPQDTMARVVQLSDRTRSANAKYCNPHGGMPTHAVTQGMSTIIDRTKKILLLAQDNKIDIVLNTLQKPSSLDNPASALKRHEDVTMVVDWRLMNAIKYAIPHRRPSPV